MKLSEIADLMRNGISVEVFRKANIDLFAERRRALRERGSVVPVRVDEDADLDVSRDDVAALCRLFASGSLDEVELGYIADVLKMADRVDFLDDGIADYLAEFTDPEINGPFTPQRAAEVLDEIGQHT